MKKTLYVNYLALALVLIFLFPPFQMIRGWTDFKKEEPNFSMLVGPSFKVCV
jgi:hypothetical protein